MVERQKAVPKLREMITDSDEENRWTPRGSGEPFRGPSPFSPYSEPSVIEFSGCGRGCRFVEQFPRKVKVLDGLIGALKDADEQVRVSAASSLGYLGNVKARLALRAASRDPSARVRRFAKESLKRLTK